MSCIDVHIQEESCSCISSVVTRIGNGIKSRVSDTTCRIASMVADATSRIATKVADETGGIITVVADAVGEHLKARCSIVCSIDLIKEYLNVTPDEVQWITDDMGVFFDVESNVEWIVVTS